MLLLLRYRHGLLKQVQSLPICNVTLSSRPSEGDIDSILNEVQGTDETRVLGFIGYTDNAYFSENTIEFDPMETGIPMVINRKTRWVVAKGQNNVRVCISVEAPPT